MCLSQSVSVSSGPSIAVLLSSTRCPLTLWLPHLNLNLLRPHQPPHLHPIDSSAPLYSYQLSSLFLSTSSCFRAVICLCYVFQSFCQWLFPATAGSCCWKSSDKPTGWDLKWQTDTVRALYQVFLHIRAPIDGTSSCLFTTGALRNMGDFAFPRICHGLDWISWQSIKS